MAYLVCMGDLRRIACDAWYLPGDFALNVARYWRDGDPELVAALESGRRDQPVQNWRADRTRVRTIHLDDPRRGVPVLAAIPNQGITDWAYHRETVHQFVDLAQTLHRPVHMQNARPTRRLFAVPLIGSGHSGAKTLKGEYIDGLLGSLEDLGTSPEFDVLLVIKDAATFSAVQAARKRRHVRSELSVELQDHACRLGHLARNGNLVVFTGVGLPAGLPSWRGLLAELAKYVDFDVAEGTPFDNLNNLDQAELIASRVGAEFADKVVQRLDVTHWAPSHSFLASLPTREHVTLNYDELFERAAASIGRPVSVLPYEPATDRWLLKLHGCVSEDRRRDIVLTRPDYMSVNTHRAALTGIVQALLVTRHMLFVGFGLGDDHLHAVLHDVRRALGNQRTGRLGTALLLEHEKLQEELWRRDLEYVAMGGGADAPRRLELFLDLLLQTATSSAAHLFVPKFDDVLTLDELALRDALRDHVLTMPHGDGAAWELVGALATQLGWSS